MEKTATLFSLRKDLSAPHPDFKLARQTSSRDKYEFIKNDDFVIQHYAKLAKAKLIDSDPIRGNTYVSDGAYDVFDVWVRTDNPDKSQSCAPNIYTREREDLTSFAEAALAVYGLFFKRLVSDPPEPDLFNYSKV